MLLPTLLLAGLWFPPAPSQQRAAHTQHSHAATQAAPTGPKSESDLHQDLAAALGKLPLKADQIEITISGDEIRLSGEIHAAEHKGVATEVARAVAKKDGWASAHVLNDLQVKLAHQ